MKNLIVTLAIILLPSLGFADGLDDGKYEISFRISDMGFTQVVTITHCTKNSTVSYYKFDVVIEEKGALKRFKDDKQIVKGIVYDGKFKFIIPYANVASLDGYYFEGNNKLKNGVFTGNGDVPFQGPNGGKNKFHFQIKKISSNKELKATR